MKSPKKKAKTPVQHNIPMTAAAAKKMGYKPSNTNKMGLHDLPESQKKKWMLFSKSEEQRTICGVRPLPGGGVEVCYIDPHTGECNDCHRSDG